MARHPNSNPDPDPNPSPSQAALLGASDRKSLDVSDLVEAVLRWLVLPPVDPAKAPCP